MMLLTRKKLKQILERGRKFTPEIFQKSDVILFPQPGVYFLHDKNTGRSYAGRSETDVYQQITKQLEGRGKTQIYMDLRHGADIEITVISEPDIKRQKQILSALNKKYGINKFGYGAPRY